MITGRYARQERFAPIGQTGQRQLVTKHVVVIGAGALGSANAEMLVRAGIGKLTLVDRDYIELSNLQRQQLYTEDDARQNRTKAKAAQRRLKAINPEVEITGIVEEFSEENGEKIVQDADFVIDGTDNFQTRFVMNDVLAKHRKPWAYGGCLQSTAIALTIIPGKTPCLQCLIDHLPQEGKTCDTVGIISPAVQVTAAYQTTECLKYLTDNGTSPELVQVDIWGRSYSAINVSRLVDPICSSCSQSAIYPYLTKEKGLKTAMLCGRDTVQVRPGEKGSLSVSNLVKEIGNLTDKIRDNGEVLIFEIDDVRFVVFQDGRTLIHGVSDVNTAKQLYQRYIGA
ncbi:thiazole biosynthesis adenylyltransferase ThiF [Virgibacillus salarius]